MKNVALCSGLPSQIFSDLTGNAWSLKHWFPFWDGEQKHWSCSDSFTPTFSVRNLTIKVIKHSATIVIRSLCQRARKFCGCNPGRIFTPYHNRNAVLSTTRLLEDFLMERTAHNDWSQANKGDLVKLSLNLDIRFLQAVQMQHTLTKFNMLTIPVVWSTLLKML